MFRGLAQGFRYFLAKREWSEHNRCEFAGWPFQAFVQSEAEEGDVGFEERHEEEQFEEDCEGHVVKVRSLFRTCRR
jgi:hypothetical protein